MFFLVLSTFYNNFWLFGQLEVVWCRKWSHLVTMVSFKISTSLPRLFFSETPRCDTAAIQRLQQPPAKASKLDTECRFIASVERAQESYNTPRYHTTQAIRLPNCERIPCWQRFRMVWGVFQRCVETTLERDFKSKIAS